MITEPTVFILGAGASKPYGYPTGKELRRKIIQRFYKRLLGLTDKIEAPSTKMSAQTFIRNQVRFFISEFEKSCNESIDLWLNRNRKYADIGKMAIALNILDAERESRY